MGIEEERQTLDTAMSSLKDDLDSLNLHKSKEEDIEERLDEITDVYIQIKQFISRRGRNNWENWGPPKWTDIERNRAALESRLSRLNRAKSESRHNFDRKMSAVTVFFMAASAIAAAFSAYYAYQSTLESKAMSESSSKTESTNTPNKAPQLTPKNGAAEL